MDTMSIHSIKAAFVVCAGVAMISVLIVSIDDNVGRKTIDGDDDDESGSSEGQAKNE